MKGKTSLLARRDGSAALDQLIQRWLGLSHVPSHDSLFELLRQCSRAHCCPRCGHGVGPGEWTNTGCGACRGKRRMLDGIIRVGAYQGVLGELIRSLKYAGRWELAPFLGWVLSHRVRSGLIRLGMPSLADPSWVVIPMPMPRWRRWYRGLDHARLLAESMASHLGLKVMHALEKRSGPPQASLSRSLRKRSPVADYGVARRGIHRLDGSWPNLSGRRVILVDDVLTTGRSMRAAGTVLRRLGPAGIVAAALAVTEAW